jgi:PII-like signaling protein
VDRADGERAWSCGHNSIARRRGFWCTNRVRTAKILELSTDLPIIEIVDTAEKIDAFLPTVDAAISDGLATVERVQIRFYRTRPEQARGAQGS